VDDDDVKAPARKDAAPAGGSAPDARLDELAQAAQEAPAPAVKALFARYVVPADRLTEPSGTSPVKPIPFRRGEWGAAEAIQIVPLDPGGKAKEPRAVKVADVRGVEHFETLVLRDAEAFLRQKPEGLSAAEHLAAAERLLAAALRFHDYARERNVRRGKTWDEVRAPLADRLKAVRLDLLRAAVAAGEPARVREVSGRLMALYPKDAEVAREVGVARVGEAERLVKAGTHPDLVRAKDLLDELEGRYPGAGGDAAARIRAQLRDVAQKAFTRAKEKKAVGDLQTARDELRRAADLDPELDGVRDLQRELRTGYHVLYVGVRQYPQNMSPAAARLDSEKQAVALVFEGLLEEVPDEGGAVRYRPGAALALPAPAPLGREFLLRAFDRDLSGRPGFDSRDVVGTLKLLAARPDTWTGYPLAWVGAAVPRDTKDVRVNFTLGHPDPRAVLTFKMLPARYLAENNRAADDPTFAEKPFGTGPFRPVSNSRADGGPREMTFQDNPLYGRWRDRTGLPQLREVRLVEASKLDPAEAFRADKLHLLPDVPTAELDRYEGPAAGGLAARVQVVTAANNRRVHVLAVNLNRPHLQSRNLRQGISMAIDRDEVLRDVFRAGKPNFHRPMTGPYPPNSWAGGRAGGPPLTNRDLAVAKLQAYLADARAKTDVGLLYPEDDPRAAAACQKIKAQLADLQRDFGGRKVTIDLEPVPTAKLHVRVQDERTYDLAYVPFDYPDDWYPYALGAALDPSAAGRGGRNWFGFGAPGTNPEPDDLRLGQVLAELRGYRDVAGQVAPRAAEAGRLFNDSLPFIPLWQLDRHMVVHRALRVYVDDSPNPVSPRLLDQTTLFQGVARWRLD
jgi:ABC-type transport system substrate-binding protein